MKKEFFVIVAYDIISDKRRRNIAKALKDYSGYRMNNSVFECRLGLKEYNEIRKSLEKIMHKKKDSILVYEICSACEHKVHYMGIKRNNGKKDNILIF